MTKAEIDVISAACNDPAHGSVHLAPHRWIDGPTQDVYNLQRAVSGAITKLTAVPPDVAGALTLLNAVKW